MHFNSSLRGYVVGDHETVLETLDGGATWSVVGVAGGVVPGRTLHSIIAFGDGSSALAVGENGDVLIRDAGSSFRRLTIPGAPTIDIPIFDLNDVVTPDGGSTFWIGGDAGVVLKLDRSIPANPIWEAPKSLTNENVHQVAFDASDHGFIVGTEFYVAEYQ